MISFRAYTKGDIFEVLDPDMFAKFEVPHIDDINEDIAWTAIEDMFIIGCGGFRKFWSGTYEAWLAVKPGAFSRNKLAGIKFIKRLLNEIPAHRIQATIAKEACAITNMRFISFLGFEFEGHLKKFGPDKTDYILYARIRP